YSLAVFDGEVAVVYQGITRADPRLKLRLSVTRQATLSGKITSAFGNTSPGPGVTVYLAPTDGESGSAAQTDTFSYSTAFSWVGGDELTTDLLALPLKLSTTEPPHFSIYGKRAGTDLKAGQTLSGIDLSLDPGVPTSSTLVTLDPGAYGD